VKLSVSNIAWDNRELAKYLDLLRTLGCDGVEVAPSRVWPEPVAAAESEIGDLAKMVADAGLVIPALHALLFTRPELKLFESADNRRKTGDYLKRLIALAGKLKARVLVFGSPKNRARGVMPLAQAQEVAVDFFRKLGEEAQSCGTCFCIEPLSPAETDFIRSSIEGYQLVQAVGSKGFGLHLDARAMHDSREDYPDIFGRVGKILQHFHVGDPGLSPPGSTGMDHAPIGLALSRCGYDGFVSLEMRQGFGESGEVIGRALAYVRSKYHIMRRE